LIVRRCIFLVLLVSLPLSIFSQDKTYKKAVSYFNNEQYHLALPLFLKADSAGNSGFEVKYYIGACYLNTSNEQPKGIPYLEYALKQGENYLPRQVFADLGRLYHLNYQFSEAVEQFEKFMKLADKKDYDEQYLNRMIEICRKAGDITKDTLKTEILSLGAAVNSEFNEVMPLISADGSQMYFTRQKISRFKGLPVDTVSLLMYAEYKNGQWQSASELVFPADFKCPQIEIAGLTPDAQWLYFACAKNGNYDLYAGNVSGNKIISIEPFSEGINSPGDEKSCSMTPDGLKLYFSSNRAGGMGGYDIYIAAKNNDGTWSQPVNAGPVINTPYNETGPFIHPDTRTLFFASDGHNTIGGYDIFTSVSDPVNASWSPPENIGFPINTTYNDMYFAVTADGNHAYFSSARGNANGNHDLYKAILRKNIPLTLVKGTITGGTPARPVLSSIKVIDRETGEKLRYIYNPNPLTGKYLMIFPPGKNYEMIIEAKDYYPYRIEIFVPGQDYFYELFQEIHLDKVIVGGNTELGQAISVRNIFYDVYRAPDDTLFKLNDTIAEKRYERLLNIISDIIETSDSVGQERLERFSDDYISRTGKKDKNLDNLLNLIEQAIETTDSSMLSIIDQTAIYQERTRKVYFYNAVDQKPEMSFVLIDGDTIWTLPLLDTRKDVIEITEKKSEQQEKKNAEKPVDWERISVKKLIYQISIYYETGSPVLNPGYFLLLSDFVRLMVDNKNMVIEIEGYSDTRGDEEKNMDLSKDRAMSVLKYFLDNYLPGHRIKIYGYGETRSVPEKTEAERKQNRRADIKLYEISY
jgi:outer membrane protein OmpA-like peptidoglycan-associated protein